MDWLLLRKAVEARTAKVFLQFLYMYRMLIKDCVFIAAKSVAKTRNLCTRNLFLLRHLPMRGSALVGANLQPMTSALKTGSIQTTFLHPLDIRRISGRVLGSACDRSAISQSSKISVKNLSYCLKKHLLCQLKPSNWPT